MIPSSGRSINFRSTSAPSRPPWSVQRDSFGATGAFAGVIASREWRGDTFDWRLGLGALAFYRAKTSRPDMETLVGVLPVASVEHRPSGVGVNLAVAPNFRHDGRDRSGFVFLQLSYRFP